MEINGGNNWPTYLYRWTLADTRFGRIYLHHFVRSDWAPDLHDHPKRFWSIGLRGSYREEYFDRSARVLRSRRYRAPWVRTFPAEHSHRLILAPGETAWTVVLVGNPRRPWGFWVRGTWVHWREYVQTAGGATGRARSSDSLAGGGR